MKHMRKLALLASLATLPTTLNACNGNGGHGGQVENKSAHQVGSGNMALPEKSAEALSEAETQGILWMREEEKLAYDVYRTLYDAWGVRVFDNISGSEQRHIAAMKQLIDQYGLTDPMDSSPIGTFKNAELQKLYDALAAKGKQSKLNALFVGAEIEELDIADLRQHLAQTQKADVRAVYDNLLRGSHNHLRAFDRLIQAEGVRYTAQHLPQADYDDIAASPQERGQGGMGRGMGNGRQAQDTSMSQGGISMHYD